MLSIVVLAMMLRFVYLEILPACLPACARLPVLPITPHGVVSYCVLMQDVVHMHEIMKGIQPHISKIPKEGS